ncbi:MAG TPA: type II secretion system F family protein [Acidimicrobiia bacterium]|nr:type II secretion system F family protein [Acidimicrobiia bacterium]
MSLRRLSALVGALVLGVSTTAMAQTAAPEIEIVDINGSRYAEGGQTQMVVEFRNLPEAPDPAQLTVTVDGQPVSNLEVAPLGESSVPVGVVLVIDTSGSMLGTPMDSAKAAANSFIDQKRPEDSIAIVSFADTAVVQTGFTTNAETLHERVNALVADGETALNDGVILGMSLFEGVPETQLNNMIVLSDGEDTASVATADTAIAAIEAGDARVFGVALESPDFNPEAVAAFATAGGGLFLSTPDPAQLSGLYGQISREISNTLVARFVSPVAAPGEAEFAVAYPGGLTSTVAFPVSGYATTTTVAPTTTTVPVTVTGAVVESSSPLSITNLALIAAAGIGLTAFLFIIILFGREEEQGGGRFAKRLQAYGRRSRSGEEEKKPFLQRIPLINRFSQAAEEEVRRRGMLSGVNAALEQANVPMSPGEAILAMIGLAAVGGVFVAIFNSPLWGLVTFGILLFGFMVLVRWAGNRERKRFEKQLPDTLTLLSTSLRAGYSLLQAIEAVATEAPDPTAREFSRAVVESRLGRSVPEALQGIVERTSSKDFEWATMAIEIQREVGGNLAEVLQTVADTMLARNRLKGEIKALTAEGRISAIVLGSLPFALGAFLWFNNRDYLQPLLDATMGRIAIVAGLILMAGGIFWLRKIVNIEV